MGKAHNGAEEAGAVNGHKLVGNVHGVGVHAVNLQLVLVGNAVHNHFNHFVAIGGNHIYNFLALAAFVGLAAHDIGFGETGADETNENFAAEVFAEGFGKAFEGGFGGGVHGGAGEAHEGGGGIYVKDGAVAVYEHGQEGFDGIDGGIEVDVDGSFNFLHGIAVKALEFGKDAGVVDKDVYLGAVLN